MRHAAAVQVRGEGEASWVNATPFLKWAGGKSAIAERIHSLLPGDVRERVYREPFLGGGAMFFYLQPRKAFLSDTVKSLIETYKTVQKQVELLIHRLEKLRLDHSDEHFYKIRERFNQERSAETLDRAAWLIYLNKTCFNGLFRTNKSGEFNVPVGRFANPRVVDPEKLRVASGLLSRAKLKHATFDDLVRDAEPDDMIYLDPPYDPISKTSSFAGYAEGGFGREDQERLAETFRLLDERRCLLALSNSDTEFVRKLYAGFDICPIIAPRAISSKSATRGEVSELLIRNLARYPAAKLYSLPASRSISG
jgi:DNA adenine methylase